MKQIYIILPLLLSFLYVSNVLGQDGYERRIENLIAEKDKVVRHEKDALKIEVEEINHRLKEGDITKSEADEEKKTAAAKRALNIENRIAIIDNEIELLERNKGEVANRSYEDDYWFDRWWNDDDPPVKYDRRTYFDLVLAFGLNNALIDGQSLENTPYKVWGSRFFEIGLAWRTRVFKNTNLLRIHYGLSFQFNGLKPENNQYFVTNNGQTELEEFQYELVKSKFRMDNLVFPVHFEFGPSRFSQSVKKVRYHIRHQFRVGIGVFGGFNMSARQKLKYYGDGQKVKAKLKRGYNTSNFIYGLSAYMGVGCAQLYIKYDLNPIFKDATIDQHNISLGLRFDL